MVYCFGHVRCYILSVMNLTDRDRSLIKENDSTVHIRVMVLL